MHYTCINSLISSGLYRPSLSLPFNDYTCFLDNRFDNRTQFSSSLPSCCCCCSNSNSIYRLPINPSLLYGLRQSTLIQCRRLLLNGGTQCFSRLSSSSSVGDFDRNCYYEKKIGSLKERGGGRGGRWGKGRYGCMVFQGGSEAGQLGNVGDEVEMMLSLLSEEVGKEECFGVRERNGRFSRSVEEVENERREDSNGMSFRSRKENMRSVGLRSSLKRDQKYETARYREEIKRRKENVREEERNGVSRCENCRVKIEGSTSKTDQGSNVAWYREEKKKQNGDGREEQVQNLSKSENCRVRKEGSTLESDLEYDTARYREEIKKQKADRREEEKEHLLRSENRKVRKEGSTSRSDNSYARYMEEIKRQKDNRREEEKEHFLRSDDHKVRKEGSTSRSDQEYARYREEIKRRKDDIREEERENLSRGENRKLRKEGSSCSSYYSVSSAGDFESDTELQVKDDRIVGQTLSEYKEDWKMNEDIRYDGEVMEKVKRRGDYVKEHEILLRKEQTAEGFYGQSTGIEHDWRKKSEKKLSEVAIEQIEYRQKSAEEDMRLSKIEKTEHLKSSDFQQQYNERLVKSTSAVNVNEGTTQEHSLNADRTSEQAESRIKYKHFEEMPEIHSSIVQTTSSSGKQYTRLEKNANTSVSLVQETKRVHNEAADRFARQDEYRRDSQENVNVSEIQEIDKRGTSSSLFETRIKKLNDDSSMVIDLVDGREEKHHKTGQLITRQTGSHANSQQMTGILGTEGIEIERMALSRRKADIRMKKHEEKSGVAYVETKVADAQRISQKSTNRQEMYVTSVAEAEVIDTKMVSEKSTSSQERSSTSVVESIDETSERHSLINKGLFQNETRKSTRRPVKASSFNEGMPKEASSSYKSLKLIPESVGLQNKGDDGGQRNSQRILMPPLRLESTSKFSSESFGSGSSKLQSQPKSSAAPGSETYGGDRRSDSCGESLDFISHEDALGSAARLQQSSTYIVGEFVDKVRHEVSTSEAQTEKKMHETKPEHGDGDGDGDGDGEVKAKSLRQDGSEGSRRSSRGSGAKGPSDEMWLVADQSIQRLPETEAPESNTTTESGVVNRTGRSLWHIIGDVVRMRWASLRSETHTSKSGGKSSPNQSTGSEAWFSGHEADENNDENAKRENTILHQGTSFPENHRPGGVRSEIQVEISSSNSESALELIGGSLPPVEGSSSGNEIVEPSFPLPAIRMRRSPVVKDISGVVKADASGSGKMVEMDQSVPVNFPGVSVTEANDGELKRRRFQRSDHVSRDRFDEWEEAHSLETEQRKIDEMFMKEALFEARKGADMWEVPVGAVLVQHGKIIARGYNLVEDLRDATAHAEMICIREASNVLKTWRLSDTTLYVTLEPCPMCAGAILQARVDTVVWGAPNKLLGADGSWIRLFPNGGGGNDLELGDKAAAGPVHPFHPNVVIRRGILSSECADVMQQFFQLRRKKKSEQPPTPPSPSCLPISHRPTKFLAKMHDAFHMMFCL